MRKEITIQATLTFECDGDHHLQQQIGDIEAALNAASEYLSEVKQGTYLTAVEVTGLTREAQTWDEDPTHSIADWKYQVDNDDTRLGYWDWVEAQHE